MDIDNMLLKYKELKEKQSRIPTSLDEWGYNDIWNPIEDELLKLFIELSNQDITFAREIILDAIETFRHSKAHKIQPICNLVNRLFISRESNILEVLSSETVLLSYKEKQGYLLFLESRSTECVEMHYIDHTCYGLKVLFDYYIRNNKHNSEQTFLSLVSSDDLPTAILDILEFTNSKVNYSSTTACVIREYINKVKKPYCDYLELLLLKREKKMPDFTKCMETIDSISLTEDYRWSLAACEFTTRLYPNNAPEVIRFIINKNWSSSVTREVSSLIYFCTLSALRKPIVRGGFLYGFTRDHYSIVDSILSTLNIRFDGRERCEYFFRAAIVHNDPIMVDQLFKSLSRNPYIKRLDSFLFDLPSCYSDVSLQIINIFKKWKPKRSNKCAHLMSYNSNEKLLENFTKCVAESFLDENISYIDNWQKKIATTNIEVIPAMVEIIFRKAHEKENDINAQLKEIGQLQRSRKSEEIYLQKNFIIPQIKKDGAMMLVRSLTCIDISLMNQFLKSNRFAYNSVKKVIMSDTLCPYDLPSVFSEMLSNGTRLNDSQVLALANMMFFKEKTSTCVELIKKMELDEDSNSQRMETKLYVIDMWNSDCIDVAAMNSLRRCLFNKHVSTHTQYGKIGSGSSDVLFRTVDIVANTCAVLASTMLDECFLAVESYANVLVQLAYSNLSINNYIQIMSLNQELFSMTCKDDKTFFLIIRRLLSSNLFLEITDIINRAMSSTAFSEEKMCNGLHKMTLLYKNVEPIDSKQIEYLATVVTKFSPSAERTKLEKRIYNL